MFRLVALAMLVMLTGCQATGFNVVQAYWANTEKVSDLKVAENNRMSSKAIDGSRYPGGKGVYVNPFVERDTESGEVAVLGFNVIDQTIGIDEVDASQNWKSPFGQIQSLQFHLSDGGSVELRPVADGAEAGNITKYNAAALFGGYKVPLGHQEESDMPAKVYVTLISLADYRRLARSSTLSCDIVGRKAKMHYGAGDIDKDFLPNIRRFFDSYVR